MGLNGSYTAQNTGPAKPGFEHLFDLIDETFLMHQAMREAIDAVESCIAMADGRRIPPNVAILGESGVGKSTVIDEMERRYPPRETEEGTIRQVVRVEIEEVPGTRSLPAWTLRALGFPTPWKGSNGELTMGVHDLAKEVGVKVFVFDEVQHFVEKDSDETLQKRANWFKRLTDETKASVVLVGLPHTVGLFHRDPQLKGRFRAPIVLPRFNWAITSEREEFVRILGGFDCALREHFDLPSLVTPEMSWHCYGACGGLMRPLWKTLRAAVHKACARGVNVIRLEDLREANGQEVFDIDSPDGLPRPFTREFSPVPTTALLASIAQIGSKTEDPNAGVSSRSRRGRRPAKVRGDALGDGE